jgi:hypothetical protein
MSTHILITCGQPGLDPRVLPDVDIGPRFGVSAFGGTAGALVLTIAAFGLGALSTLVLIILFATRGPRRPRA